MATPFDSDTRQKWRGYFSELESDVIRSPLNVDLVKTHIADWIGESVDPENSRTRAIIAEVRDESVAIKLPGGKIHSFAFREIIDADTVIRFWLAKGMAPESWDFREPDIRIGVLPIHNDSYAPTLAERIRRIDNEEIESDATRPFAALGRSKKAAPKSSMNINRFFIDVLGANLRNARWSWGAVDPMTDRVFLRVWKDDFIGLNDGQRVQVSWDKPRRDSNGYAERQRHLDLIRNGAEGFGVVCTAVDPFTRDARIIADFDHAILLRLGRFTKEDGRTYADIAARIPVDLIARQRTAQSTLAEDIKSIIKRKIESTTKEALVTARLGQGRFRSQVLQLWSNSCSVTQSRTHDAIRASHIKPWSESTDEERLDPENGLPLVASLDALFDAGLISFKSSGRMIVSPHLNAAERQIYGLCEQSLAQKPTAKMAEYLKYHRVKVFKS